MKMICECGCEIFYLEICQGEIVATCWSGLCGKKHVLTRPPIEVEV